MKKTVLPSVATLLFSFGNGFLFFAVNYAYREYKMQYPLSVIVVALIVGVLCIFCGMQLLVESVSKAKNK